MLDLFHRGPHEQISAEIVRSLTPRTVGRVPHRYLEGTPREHLHLLTFDLPTVPRGEVLLSAQLRLTVVFLGWDLRPAQGVVGTVSVYWDSTEALMRQRLRDQEAEQKVVLDCTELINRFQQQNTHGGGELQLVVGVTVDPRMKVHPLISGDHVDSQPLLLLLYSPGLPAVNETAQKTSEGSFQRNKREMPAEDYEEETNKIWSSGTETNARQKRQRNLCRRRPLYVEFSDIHYDNWIVAPSGYQAYQCAGKCVYPVSDHLSPTKHSIIQTLLHSLHPTKAPRSCCVPTRLDSISILYLDQGVLTYRLSYRDMVVAECGCR